MRNSHSRVSAVKWRFMVKRPRRRRQKLTANKRGRRPPKYSQSGRFGGRRKCWQMLDGLGMVTQTGAFIWRPWLDILKIRARHTVLRRSSGFSCHYTAWNGSNTEGSLMLSRRHACNCALDWGEKNQSCWLWGRFCSIRTFALLVLFYMTQRIRIRRGHDRNKAWKTLFLPSFTIGL